MFLWLWPRSVSECCVKVIWLFSCSDIKMSHCDKDLHAFPFAMSDYLPIKAWTSQVTLFQLLSVTSTLSAGKCSNSFIKILSFSKHAAAARAACHRHGRRRLFPGRRVPVTAPSLRGAGGCRVGHAPGHGCCGASWAGRGTKGVFPISFFPCSCTEILAYIWIFKID